MLTRLKVSGFKNLVDVDIHFGAFTCIAGVNGVGNSNLFDAIRFLSALAEYPLKEAALLDRDGNNKTGDIRHLFHRVGNHYIDKISFEVEMIIPKEGVDSLIGQPIKAISTFLKYCLELGYTQEDSIRSIGKLEILKEELIAIKKKDIDDFLLFDNRSNSWIDSIFQDKDITFSKFISTETQGNKKNIIIRADTGLEDVTEPIKAIVEAKNLQATNLCVSPHVRISADRTLVLARQEMIFWKQFLLEPSCLRSPNNLTDPKKILCKALETASELRGRRLKKFNERQAIHRLAEIIRDFSPLYQLSAFQALKQDLSKTLKSQRWL